MISREERDLMVRWCRQMRREAYTQPEGELALWRLPRFPLRHIERIHARMRALDPRALTSVPSARRVA